MTDMHLDENEQELLKACVKLIGSTGATAFTIRYEDTETPTVWIAVAKYGKDDEDVNTTYQTGSDVIPIEAVLRLCERLIDGGICIHCNKTSGFDLAFESVFDTSNELCWYSYDPETKEFRRSCET